MNFPLEEQCDFCLYVVQDTLRVTFNGLRIFIAAVMCYLEYGILWEKLYRQFLFLTVHNVLPYT